MALFKISKGTSANLPADMHDGYCYFTIDDGKFYIDYIDINDNDTLKRRAITGVSVEYIEGTQTVSTNKWTGVTKDANLYKGKIIAYKLPQAGTSSAATLNLTLSNGTTSGAKAVKRQGTSNTTTHYPAGTVIFMAYDGTYWQVNADYDSDSDKSVTQSASTSADWRKVLLHYTANAEGGAVPVEVTNKVYAAQGIEVQPSTGTLAATKFKGPLQGNADTATSFNSAADVILTGDVSGSASSTKSWNIATTLKDSGVDAGYYGPSANATPDYGTTFNVPYIKVDAKGRIIEASTKTVKIPASDNTNTATAADNILAGSNSGTQITYSPYKTQQSKLSFDTSTTAPARTDRLNLNGYLYATKLYSGGAEVLTSHQSLANYKTKQTPIFDSTGTLEESTTATQFIYSISQNENGEISVKTRSLPTYNNYSLPLAASGTRGGIKIGYQQSEKNYPVQLDNEKAYVNVPWTDTDTKVTQNIKSDNKDYRIILSYDANDTDAVINTVNKATNLRYNPSTNKLSTINLDLTGELDVVGNAYLHNQTTADALSAGSLIVTGNSNFVQIPTTQTAPVGDSSGKLATTEFVSRSMAQGLAANDAMVFKGTIGDTASPTYASISSLPTSGYSAGWTYRVVTSGSYISGTYCEIGDLIIAINDGPTTGSSVLVRDWTIAQTNIDGALFKYKNNSSSPTVDYNGDRLLASVGSGGAVKELEINASGTNSLTLSAAINNNTLNITGSIGTLGVGNGGTGKTSWTQYGLIYASTENTLAQVTAEIYDYANKYQYLMSNGAAAPIWSTALTLDAVDSTNETNSHFPILQSGSSLDSLKTPGVYAVRSSGIGKTITGYPRGSLATSGGKVIVFGGYPNYGHQFVLGSTIGAIFHRVTTSSSSGTNWEETWYRLVHAPSAKSAVGDTNKGVYLTEDGILAATNHTVDADVPSNAVFTDTDTKNTAGSTDTSSQIYLIGAIEQATNPQTYSDNEVYVKNGVLTAKTLQLTSDAAETTIKVSRTSGVNYIHAPATGGLAICASDDNVALATSSFIANATEVRSGKNNTFNLGTSTYKWKNVYATNFNGSGANLTNINGDNISSGTVAFGRLPSMYWANTAIASAASYNTAPEVATIKLNGDTEATAASTKNVVLQYDSTLEVLNFVFS